MTTEEIISLDTMLEPIERFFERNHRNPSGLVCVRPTPDAPNEFLYLEKGINGLHAIRFEELYDDCILDVETGIHELCFMPANFHWLALPMDEFRDGEESFNGVLESEAKERGFGILVVQFKGRGLSVKVIVNPTLREGEHIETYPELYKQWKNLDRKPGSREGYQVVNFY